MILHNFPAFCLFRVSHIGAAGYSSLVGGYAVAIGNYRGFGGSYYLNLQGQHEETTTIRNVCYHSQSSRHNILEDSNILRTQWPVSRSSHSNPGKINPAPNKQKVAWLRAAMDAVQKGKILYPSGNRRIPLSLDVQPSLHIIGPLSCTCFKYL